MNNREKLKDKQRIVIFIIFINTIHKNKKYKIKKKI